MAKTPHYWGGGGNTGGTNTTGDNSKIEASTDDDTFPPALIHKTLIHILVNPINVVAPSGIAGANKYPSVIPSNNMFLPPPLCQITCSTPQSYAEG